MKNHTDILIDMFFNQEVEVTQHGQTTTLVVTSHMMPAGSGLVIEIDNETGECGVCEAYDLTMRGHFEKFRTFDEMVDHLEDEYL